MTPKSVLKRRILGVKREKMQEIPERPEKSFKNYPYMPERDSPEASWRKLNKKFYGIDYDKTGL